MGYFRAENCPEADKHTPCPGGYLQWHDWARRKARTHRSVRCSACNLFAIWVPKKRRAITTGGDNG